MGAIERMMRNNYMELPKVKPSMSNQADNNTIGGVGRYGSGDLTTAYHSNMVSVFKRTRRRIELQDWVGPCCRDSAEEFFKIGWDALMRIDRSRDVVRMRRMVYAAIAKIVVMPQVKYPEVMGGRDRSTILHALAAHEVANEVDSLGYCPLYAGQYKQWLEFLTTKLNRQIQNNHATT